MTEKRKYSSHLNISNIASVQNYSVDRSEISRLTKVAKSWEFTCSFCFKAFPSAQAMGGHQNAHRTERLEEKRLFVRDPIGYRKRAYLQAVKAMRAESSGSTNLNAASESVTHEPPKSAENLGKFNSAPVNGEIMNGFPLVVTNFLPIEEVGFAGSLVEDAKGKKNMEFNDGGSRMASEDLDLTLKL